MPTPHQAFFISRLHFYKVGLFDERFSLSSDFDYVCRSFDLSSDFYLIPASVGAFRKGGASGKYTTFYENFGVMMKHGVNPFSCLLLFVISLAKLLTVKFLPSPLVVILRRVFSSGRFSSTQIF